MTVSVGSVGWA